MWYKINVSLPDPEEDQGDEAADDEADALLAADDAESSESPSSSSATVTPNNIRTYPPSELSVSVASASVDVTNPSSATFLLVRFYHKVVSFFALLDAYLSYRG